MKIDRNVGTKGDEPVSEAPSSRRQTRQAPQQENALDTIARANGIHLKRPTPDGAETPISDETKRKLLEALRIDVSEDAVTPPERSRRTPIPRCHVHECLEEGRVWGLNLQLYELRSSRNWGIGDFEDLAMVAEWAGTIGADFIGLNPLHAPFLADPERCSPYEPSNRQFLNPLYIAVDRIPGCSMSPGTMQEIETLRQRDLVDYGAVASLKRSALRQIWKDWPAASGGLYGEERFRSFLESRGEMLRRHALFEALSDERNRSGDGAGWHGWPEAFQRPDGPAVAAFAGEHADDIRFHTWLQWIAHEQLSLAAERAKAAGLRIGLYLDVAVGEALDGSATWSERDLYLASATIGSPPDPFAAGGQDWHLAAFLPSALASGQDSPFERMITASMRYSGAVRIDHAAALRRLFLVPVGMPPDGGAYVDYPQDQLLAILAKASQQHGCLVVGEDLGLLPEGLQANLEASQVLSYRILSYEREKDGFKPAEVYPRLALACISTHDHQTLDGWWRGADIGMRERYGILPPDVTADHRRERRSERKQLIEAMEQTGLDAPQTLSAAAPDDRKMNDLIVSAHRFIARTPSILASVRLADLTRQVDPTNVPGTDGAYPNWKPKLSVPIEHLADLELVRIVAQAMRDERPKQS